VRRDPRADSFAQFYQRHYRPVAGLAYTLTGSWVAAEDVAQEAFVRAYRDWPKVGEYDRPDSWVRTVAVNLATSRGRRLAAEARAIAKLRQRRERPQPEALPEDAETFWNAVRSLPRRQAQAAALRYHDDLSVAQIAAAMGCAEGTAKAHLHAARKALAAMLHADGEDDR
jgi:RNA polymerase sigma-70 factor (ECF subfamily)